MLARMKLEMQEPALAPGAISRLILQTALSPMLPARSAYLMRRAAMKSFREAIDRAETVRLLSAN